MNRMRCAAHVAPIGEMENAYGRNICTYTGEKTYGRRTTPCRRIGEWRYSSTHSSTSALDGGEWSASSPGRFTPKERAPRYPLDRRLGGPQSRYGRGGEEKNLLRFRMGG
jgi:hypothetical protein